MSSPAHAPISPATPALSPERPVAWPKRTTATLSNGLEIVLVESHTIPKITAQLVFRSGNAAAIRELPGLAEITASVVRTGTTSRTSRQIEEDLRRMGADLSSSAGSDSSSISLSGLTEFSADLFTLLADLAQNASFPPAEFERERRQWIEGLKLERQTPGFLAGERVRKTLFAAHPYGTVAPEIRQVEMCRRRQLIRYYRTHYSPKNALLLVVGDFDSPRLLRQIEKILGPWRGPQPKLQKWPAPPALTGRRVHHVHFPGTDQAQILVGNLAITRNHPDWFALSLANSIYGGAFNSRLVANIREQKGYTYSPRSGVQALRNRGYLSIGAAVRNEVTAATLTEIFYELDRMRAIAVTAEELDDNRNYLSGVFSLGLATQDGLAGQLATVYLNRLPENYLETYRQRIRALTANDVLAAARRWFDAANATIVIVGDPALAEQAALFGPVTAYPAPRSSPARPKGKGTPRRKKSARATSRKR